jgi:hypothetical protein
MVVVELDSDSLGQCLSRVEEQWIVVVITDVVEVNVVVVV